MDTWLSFAVWDPIVHTWDLAEAVDQPTIVDSRSCELALSAARESWRYRSGCRAGIGNR